MAVASACPDRDQLNRLIEGSLPDVELERLTDHIETCATCQATLETVATGEFPISSWISSIDQVNPPTQSAYWQAVSNLKHDPSSSDETDQQQQVDHSTTQVFSSTSGSQASQVDLSFLAPSDDPAYIGKLHHFQIARVIGQGGMGIVLEAFDTHLHRSVAIKVLNPQFQQNEIARQRFCREGRAAAAIAHEHVVSMHQVAKAEEGEVAYLVMQLIEGDTLEDLLAAGQPLPPQDVARIAMQTAAGLAAAHLRGMVHRDIKPGNILIEKETGRVKLTDFGLARAADEVKLTSTGMVTGTPLYMSPEQAMGSTPDERSDLFSLGAVTYEMATGVSPFQAPTAVGVMKKVMDLEPEPPHRVNPSVSKPLSDLIMALLAKKPEARPHSAVEVTQALASIVNEFGPISPLQVPAVAASEVKRLSGTHRTRQRRWFIASSLAALFGLTCLVGAFAIWYSNGESGTELEAYPSVVLPDNPGTVWSVDFAPDGKHIAAAVEDGSVRLWDIEAQQVVRSFGAHRGVVWMVQFHPNGQFVVTSGDDGYVKLWDAESFEPIREWKATNAVRGVAFSPDGSRMVAGDREGMIFIYDLESDEPIASRRQPGAIFGVDYAPDGKLIATVGSDKTVRLWDAISLDERQSMSGHDGPIYNVRFAEAGPLLATVGWNKNVRLWNVETGSEVASLQGSDGDVWGVAFCGGASHLVTGGQDGTARIWDLSDGSVNATLRGHDAAVHNISLDPTAHRIASSSRDGTIRVWDLTGLKE